MCNGRNVEGQRNGFPSLTVAAACNHRVVVGIADGFRLKRLRAVEVVTARGIRERNLRGFSVYHHVPYTIRDI